MTEPMRHSLMCAAEWARHHLYPGPMPEPVEERPKTYPEGWEWFSGSRDVAPGWEWVADRRQPTGPLKPRGLWVTILRLLG